MKFQEKRITNRQLSWQGVYMEAKSIFQSKTFWVNAIVILAGILNEAVPVVQDQTLSRSAIIYAILMIVLRKLSTGPVEVKAPKRRKSVKP